MADHKRRKTGKKQPITRHPLFPAIVGLWCGAIAGLCSIAVPTALIERLVSVTRLDSVLPMAAPPLGATFRIACALAATALGAFVGGLLSRRLARKAGNGGRKVSRKQARQAAEAAQNETVSRLRRRAGSQEQASGESDAEPALAEESNQTAPFAAAALDVDDTQDVAGERVLASAEVEREARAVETAEVTRAAELPEQPRRAPVAPGILDVSEFDLGEDEFDTGRFASEDPFAPIGDEPETAATTHAQPASTLADFEEADFPVMARAHQNGPQVFVRNEAPALPTASNEDDAFPAFLLSGERTAEIGEDAHEDAPDSGNTIHAFATIGEEEAGDYAAFPAIGATRSADALHGAQASLSELAHRIGATPPAGIAPRPGFELLSRAKPEVEHEIEAACIASEDLTAADQDERDGRNAARRIASSALGSLSHLELLERLALAMDRRREEIESAARALVIDDVADDEGDTAVTEPVDTADAHTPTSDAPAHFAAKQNFVQSHDEQAEPEEETAATHDHIHADDDFESRPIQFLAGTPDALDGGDDVPDEQVAADVPHAVPAAMRPVDPTRFEEEDEDFALPGYIPPRHIGLARPFAGNHEVADDHEDEVEVEAEAELLAGSLRVPALAASDLAQEHDEGQDEAEEEELKEGYSSLLDLSRPSAPRQEFIRIEEPDSEDIEPVVIFPGEEARRAAAFARPGETVAALPRQPEASARDERRFDAPGRQDGPQQDNAQTEQALRAALATLQRMSGAA